MTRLQELEAVAEAARKYVESEGGNQPWHDLCLAVEALPADPEPARGEVVGMAKVVQIASAFDTDPQGIYGAHVVTTALCADGSVWMRRYGVGTPGEWACLPLVKGGGA
jgi:hypothetical protein